MAVNGIELAVGQKWKTRGGDVVEIISNMHGNHYPWALSSGESVNKEGYIWDDYAFDSGDLITLVQDEHGFTPWGGGDCPVSYGVKIEYKMKNDPTKVFEGFPGRLRWEHTGMDGEIIAYRVVKQKEEKPKQMKGTVVETKTEAKEEPKYTVKEVFDAIIAETAFTPFPSVEQVQKHLARINSPDYNLYLQLKAKFE